MASVVAIDMGNGCCFAMSVGWTPGRLNLTFRLLVGTGGCFGPRLQHLLNILILISVASFSYDSLPGLLVRTLFLRSC